MSKPDWPAQTECVGSLQGMLSENRRINGINCKLLARIFVVFVAVFMAGTSAHAHRPGESYIYLIVSEAALRGEFHIRFTELAKVFEMDLDNDEILTDREVASRHDSIGAYLAERLRFHHDGEEHSPVIGKLAFFGPETARQIKLHFEVPTLAPPPDELEVSYRFLYDELDPEHLPMLLFKSNTRMRLAENEWVVSLVFREGEERQTVSLLPQPFPVLVPRLGEVGLRQILTSPYHFLVVLLAVIPCAWVRSDGRWRGRKTPGGVAGAVVSTGALFAAGFTGGIFFREFVHYMMTDWQSTSLVLAAGAILLLDNLYPLRFIKRWVPLVLAGALCGASRTFYRAEVGLEKSLYEFVLPGVASGIFLAALLIAASILTLAMITLPRPVNGTLPVAVSSTLVLTTAAVMAILGWTL